MRSTWLLVFGVGIAALVACGSEAVGDGASSGGNNNNGNGPGFSGGGDGDGGAGNGPNQNIDVASMRIEPADAVLTITPGQSVTQTYRLFGKLQGTSNEIDLTSRAVFYVPDNYLVGTFPLDGSPTFTSRLPVAANDPPQRGGKATIRATISNSDGPKDVTTSLTLKMNATISNPNVPGDAATKFGGTVDAARAPKIYYPNDGVMLPPNLRRLEVHWKPKGGTNLYEVAFRSAVGEVVYYTRCGAQSGYLNGSCAFELNEAGYNALAYTNAGAGPVTLRIRGTKDDASTTYGESSEIKIEFAQNRVDGGLYYWNVSQTSIMRFDFGAATGSPQTFADHNSCVGCHALSRDGKKMVASLNGAESNGGKLVFTNDVSAVTNQTSSFTRWDDGANRLQFASFNPDGSQFVGIYGEEGQEPNRMWFHDGTTGVRGTFFDLPFRPNHPDWSPDGTMIAVTHVNGNKSRAQWTTRGNVELVKKQGSTWSTPIVVAPLVTDRHRFNPNFVPDSSFLYFTESTCPAGQWDSGDCDGDADPTATTYAAKPEANAKLVHLANAAKRGEIDIDQNLASTGDTFPRSAPFKTDHRGGQLFWFTVASRRRAGLKNQDGPQHLWMFAVDPAKVLAGEDGSYTGFYLPFQDLNTSNHIGQWTERIVGGTEPPPVPPPPPPPPPPAPPGPK